LAKGERRVVDTVGVREQCRDRVTIGFVKRVEPVVVDHGEGAILWDEDGIEHIDGFAGSSVGDATGPTADHGAALGAPRGAVG